MSERVLLKLENGIAIVSLNRADKHNGMDFEMLDAVLAMQRRLRRMRELRGVIVRGEGPSFCAGLDIQATLRRPLQTALRVLTLWSPVRNQFQRWSMGWRELAVPVIALVHGNCFGAGLQLALGADFRLATPTAQLSFMEAKWGLVPDMGGVALMRELMRLDQAKELTLTGRVIDAEQARCLGLVTEVAADPMARALALLAEIMARSPDSVAAGKKLLQQAWTGTERQALQAERRWQRRLIGGINQRIAVARATREPERAYRSRRVG